MMKMKILAAKIILITVMMDFWHDGFA